MKTHVPVATVLMYHRIDYTKTDPWNICVSPASFEKQICFFKKNYDVIPVEKLINQVKQNNIQHGSICITFDDGYADNFIYAKPVLEKYNCPAIFFIPTAFINGKFFWWDELEEIFLHTENLPHYLQLKINDKQHEYFIQETKLTNQQLILHKKWKWFDNAPTTRCNAFLKIRTVLQLLPLNKIQQIINEIKVWAEFKKTDAFNRCTMSSQQLHLLTQHELFSIGLHTNTHTALEGKSEIFQTDEVLSCKNYLLSNFNIQLNILAYPYGLLDDTSLQISKSLKLDACFTTKTGGVNHTNNIYALNRLQVCDYGVDYLHQQLQKIFQ